MNDYIIINGRQYLPTETVSWDDAIAEGDFYFYRARYLGLQPPIAAIFGCRSENFLEVSKYREKFREAEARKSQSHDWNKYDRG